MESTEPGELGPGKTNRVTGKSELEQGERTRKREEIIVLGQAQEWGKLGKQGMDLQPTASPHPSQHNHAPLVVQNPHDTP